MAQTTSNSTSNSTSDSTEAVWHRLRKVLNDIDFPADKDDLVAHAEQRGADEAVLRLLRALPIAEYRNISELRSSVPLDPTES
jgi:hypothetical protein